MKRILLLTFLLTLLCAASARATVWFPNGHTLHRDPLCIYNDFSAESCLEKTLSLTRAELEDTDYLLCTRCCASLPIDETPDETPVVWYYNPNSGEHLHRDPDCHSVSAKYKPLIEADRLPAQVIPANVCNLCGRASGEIESLFDNAVWNSTPVEKASMLPGVWTLPSENALPVEDVVAHAKRAAATISLKTVHSAIPLHYDHDEQGNPRETWRVVVTTTLMHPVCVVNFDALTGEYLGMRISREYSEKLLLADPEKLCLEAAEGAKVEILANQVNLRETPSGDFIARLNKGEVLTLLGEGRKGSTLSYLVYSPKYGEGFVRSTFAQIVHNGNLRGNGSALTDNLLAYCQELRRWQIENGFLARNANGEFVFTMDKALETTANKEALLSLMQKHGITATVGGTAPFILVNHYGVYDLWDIFDARSAIIPGLRVEDWHSPDFPTEEEQQRLADALAAVDAEYP